MHFDKGMALQYILYSDLRPLSKQVNSQGRILVGQRSSIKFFSYSIYHDWYFYRQLCEHNFTKILALEIRQDF